MSDGHQPCDIYERRQTWARVNELRSSCEHLTKVRDSLAARLSELDKVVDKLIAEKDAQKYDPHLKINYEVNDVPSSRHNQNAAAPLQQKSPSDAFKIKLSNCLQEIEPKAKEILTLIETLPQSGGCGD